MHSAMNSPNEYAKAACARGVDVGGQEMLCMCVMVTEVSIRGSGYGVCRDGACKGGDRLRWSVGAVDGSRVGTCKCAVCAGQHTEASFNPILILTVVFDKVQSLRCVYP